jgi:hypothetical protein
MTGREFMNAVANGRRDVLADFLRVLADLDAGYCVVEGLAVNAYAEPVVSLDLDVVVAAQKTEGVVEAAGGAGFDVSRFGHSVNLNAEGSDFRIQLWTDERYQAFLARAAPRNVLGYDLKVAAAEDVLAGKIWAWSDPSRRPSKRKKDLADIARLVE